VADFLHPSGFMQFVAALHAEFCSELVVNLYSGWFPSLLTPASPGALNIFSVILLDKQECDRVYFW
jgi:hypothetical protein